MTDGTPKLLFLFELDEQAAYEAEARGYLSHAQVELPDGRKYPVVFYDPVRLRQDLEEEGATGSSCIAEPGMIVIANVTLEEMEKAVSRLYREGYFASFRAKGE